MLKKWFREGNYQHYYDFKADLFSPPGSSLVYFLLFCILNTADMGALFPVQFADVEIK